MTDDIYYAICKDDDVLLGYLIGIRLLDKKADQQFPEQTHCNNTSNTGQSIKDVHADIEVKTEALQIRGNDQVNKIQIQFDPDLWNGSQIWPRISRRMSALQLTVRQGKSYIL